MLKQVIGTALFAGAAVLSASASAAQFPLKSDDLNLNHRYKTGDHSTGALQGYGKDIIALRPTGGNNWSDLTADGVDSTVNSNHLIYGRKVYATVSGTVVNCWRNAAENSKAGTKDADVLNFYIGQYLGLAGNSGNSTGPHVHVHMEKNGAAYPMSMEHGQTTPFTNGVTPTTGPWTLLNGNTLPTGNILVWAPRSTAYWTVNNISSAAFQGWFNHMTDSGQMPENMPCSNGGATYNTDWVPSQGAWYARAGMSAAELATQTNTLAQQGFYQYKWWYCDSVRSAIWRK